MKTEKKKRIIEFQKVNYSYENNPAVENITFSITEKDFFGIIGPNGGGKTTILKLMLGLISPQRGTVRVFGKDPRLSHQLIGYVPQYATFDFDFPISVEEVVLAGRLSRAPLFGGYGIIDKKAAMEAMDAVGIADLSHRALGSLSGGQRQRVLIARAIVSHPEILLLDEPTANIDIGIEESIYELLKKLNTEITVILVSHDVGFITGYVKKVACINRSLVCHPASKLRESDIAAMYQAPMHFINHKHKI
jgi:zinc transport system ATP-binding protein